MLKKITTVMAAACCIALLSSATLAQGNRIEKTWTVNFKDSDIHEVIKFLADVTGKTVVIDPRVKGRVKVISNRALNERELVELFRSVLEVHDVTVVEVGSVMRILPLKEARSSPLPVVEEGQEKDGDGYITQVIQLKNIAAAKVLPVLRPLIPQHSHLAAYDPSNAIVVSDTKENIARLREVIEQIDTAALPTTEIIQLKYADAQDLVSTLSKLSRADKKSSANELTIVADKRNNAVLVTGEDVQRQRMKLLIRKLDRSQPQSGNVRVVYLEYAKAKDVADVLTKVAANMAKLSPGDSKSRGRGSDATVVADEDTNALLITAQGDMLNSLMAVVERLDIRRAQILVEAIIVQVDVTDGENLGLEWLFTNEKDGNFGSSTNQGNISALSGLLGAGDGDTSDAVGSVANGLAAIPGLALGAAGTEGDIQFGALLTALRTSSKANVLSTPSVLTMDNSEASISVGQNVPFATGSYTSTGGTTNPSSPFTTFQREDIGINLKVTPQVNEGDNVVMLIEQEVSNVSSQEAPGGGGIITNQSVINTEIMAKNGEIVVLGGLIKEDVQDSSSKVPILGSIPVLGYLFKSQRTNVVKNNLMVFLRAKIIRSDEVIHGATAEKYRDAREWQLEQREQGLPLMDDALIPLLPELNSNQPKASIPDVEEVTTPAELYESQSETEGDEAP